MIPLVYSCSGCSGSAQKANQMALDMNASGDAEMSCIAGVGGGVAHLVKKALSGRDIIAIDGCKLGCVAACLANHGIEPTEHRILKGGK